MAAAKAKIGFTKEEEVLLSNYSPAVSAKGSVIFYVNSFFISLAPIYLFYGVNQMEVSDSWIAWAVAVAASSYLLSYAAKNLKHVLKHKIVIKRGEAVSREINRKFADDKKMSRKEKEERVLFRKNEVADNEATYLAVFWNNVLFIALLLFFSFFLLANLNPVLNSLFSIVAAAGLVALFSTAKQ